jgi:O-antigen ligase
VPIAAPALDGRVRAAVPPTPADAAAAGSAVSHQADRLTVGIVAVVVTLLPLAVPAGPANVVPEDAFIGLAIVACLVWGVAARHAWRLPYAAPVCLLLLGGALGAIVGPVPLNGIVALVQDVALIAWCWVIVNIGHAPRNLRILLGAWIYGSIVWALLLYTGLATGVTALTGQVAHQGSRVQLTLADPSYAANYFFISLMLMWATARPRRRPVRYVAYAALVMGIVLTGSNSGAVSLVVGTIVAALIGIRRRSGLVAAVAALSVALLGGAVLAQSVSLADIQAKAQSSGITFLRDGVGRGTSVQQRSMLFDESLVLYRHGSVFGEGPVSTKERLRHDMAPFEKEAHDDYVAALIERGFLGFAGVLLLVAGLAWRMTSLARDRLSPGFAAIVVRPNALIGAVAGTMVAGLVYELLHVRHVWALFGILAAVCLWGRGDGTRG